MFKTTQFFKVDENRYKFIYSEFIAVKRKLIIF